MSIINLLSVQNLLRWTFDVLRRFVFFIHISIRESSPMELYADFKRLLRQARGKENIFGYKTTLANQLYLLYCIAFGQIYFTEKLHTVTRYTWLCWVILTNLYGTIIVIGVLLFGNVEKDLVMVVFSVFPFLAATLETIIAPIIAMIWHKNKIESMIKVTDKILLLKKVKKSKQEIDIKKGCITLMILFWLPLIGYGCIGIMSVIFFYKEEKVKNYVYYMAPLPLLEKYGSLKIYLAVNSSLVCFGIPLFLHISASLLYTMIWAAVCHNEVQRVVIVLNLLNDDENLTVESYKNIEPKFRDTIKQSKTELNDLISMMKSFQGFFRTISGLRLAVGLYVETLHALLIVSSHHSFTVRAKEVAIFIVSVSVIFTICWVGNTLNELRSTLSFAVYSTPWYWLKRIRKDLYILLCQAQTSVQLTALKVYPLSLITFLRFLNVTYSAVRIFKTVVEE